MSEKLSNEQSIENLSLSHSEHAVIESENMRLTTEDVEKSACFLDSWFIRASWSYKKEFLFKCLEHLCKDGLEQVVLLLGPPVKDYYYSLSGYTNNADDIIPRDDNRQLDKVALDKARDSDFLWLLSLPRQQFINIVIGLTELCGSALRMHLYEKALLYLQEVHITVRENDDVPKTPNENNPGLPKDVNKDNKEYHTYKANLDKYNDFIDKLKGKLSKKNGRDKKKKTEKESAAQDSLDYIQILPAWINRQILAYLDEETLNKCQKVNSYWKDAVKELRREREVRNKLDNLIAKLQPAEVENGKQGKSKSEKSEKKKRTSARKSSETRHRKSECLESKEEEVTYSTHRVEMINAFTKCRDRFAFRKQHLLIWTIDEYMDNRLLALGKRWLAFSRGDEIILCNLLSFANMPGTISGHGGKIIAMAFHPEDGQLISAGSDSTVRRWEVWSRQEVHNFNFPSVKDIVANAKYYVVAGTNIIKVFCWESNLCQWTVEVEEPSTINTVTITPDNTMYITYSPDNNIQRICAKNGSLLLEIPAAHCTGITCLYHCGLYFLTSSEDGCVNVWKSDETEPVLLAKRNFLRKINNVILHDGCILAGGDNGEFYIWDVVSDEIVHTSTINEDSMPISNMKLLNYYDHCKVILNSEMGIKILQFMYERKSMKKKGFSSPQTFRALPAALTNTDKAIIMRDKNKESKIKEQMMKRQACHPNLRKDLDKIVTIRESSQTMLRQDLGDLRYFPAIYGEPVKPIIKYESPENKDDDTTQTKFSNTKLSTLKNILPIHNPYKHRF